MAGATTLFSGSRAAAVTATMILLVTSRLSSATEFRLSTIAPLSLRSGALRVRGGSDDCRLDGARVVEVRAHYAANGDPAHTTTESTTITLGDLERTDFRPPSSSFEARSSTPPPLTTVVRAFLRDLHRDSPTLSVFTVLCVAVWIAWRIPAATPTLRRHFVCGRDTVVAHRRLHAAVLSASSHTSFAHLVLNLYALVSLGTPLAAAGTPLWPLAWGGALAGGAASLALSRAPCLGASGVACALLVATARRDPGRRLAIAPALLARWEVPAAHAAQFLVAASAAGTVLSRDDGVAHACHLGGALFGHAWYELRTRTNALTRLEARTRRWGERWSRSATAWRRRRRVVGGGGGVLGRGRLS